LGVLLEAAWLVEQGKNKEVLVAAWLVEQGKNKEVLVAAFRMDGTIPSIAAERQHWQQLQPPLSRHCCCILASRNWSRGP
jgi:hypothetical protein